MEFVAIDFETASRRPDSACSIGLVRMDGEGKTVDSFYSLICPPDLYFDPACTAVHKLKPEDVVKAPKFDVVWPGIVSFISTDPLVAHNARFDIGVLKACIERYGLPSIHNDYYCTLSLSRKLWKGRSSYKLISLASSLGLVYDAHNALEDASTCGRLFATLCGDNLIDPMILDRFFSRVYPSGDGYPKSI